MLIKKTHYSYVIGQETILVFRNEGHFNQAISFNSYHLHSKKKFYQFRKMIVDSEPKEYDNLNDIYGLAREYSIRGAGANIPKFIGGNNIAI